MLDQSSGDDKIALTDIQGGHHLVALNPKLPVIAYTSGRLIQVLAASASP